MTQTKKGTDTRERVLDEAVKQYYLQGYKDTTMRSLANAVGIKHPSLFSIFKNKSDIAGMILRKYYFSLQEYSQNNILENTNIPDDSIQVLLLFYALNYIQVHNDPRFAKFYSEFYEDNRLAVDEVTRELQHIPTESLTNYENNIIEKLDYESLGVISMMLIKKLQEKEIDAKTATLYFVSKIYPIQQNNWNISFPEIEKYYNQNWEKIETISNQRDFYQLASQ